MTTRKVWFLVLIMAVLLPSLGWAGKPTTQYNGVEIVFRDATGDRIQTDDLGVSYVDGANQIRATLDDTLSFFACSSSAKLKQNCPDTGTRNVFLDFSDQTPDGVPGPTSLGLPFPAGEVAGEVETFLGVNLLDANGGPLEGGFAALVTGLCQQRFGRMKVNFRDESGLMYTIRFRPSVELHSNWVLVTYIDDGGQVICDDDLVPCASWTVEALTGTPTGADDLCFPSPAPLDDIGTLLSDNSNDEGDYRLPFLMTITALPQPAGDGGGGGGNGGGKGKPKR